MPRHVSLPATRVNFADLVRRGAQAVILGCTEFGMLLEAGASSVPLIDTTLAHAQTAVKMALQESAAQGLSDVSGNGWRAGLVSRRRCAPARVFSHSLPRTWSTPVERPFYDDQMSTCLEEWRRPPDRETLGRRAPRSVPPHHPRIRTFRPPRSPLAPETSGGRADRRIVSPERPARGATDRG
jgi:hypothetical protein